MAPFYGWGSTASRLQPLQGGSLLLVNNPKHPLHAKISFKIIYFKRGLSKSLKVFIFTFIFLLNPVPFNGQSYLKQ